MSKTPIEIVWRVWEEKEGVFLEVGEWSENPDCLCIRTTTPESVEWFGQWDMSMAPEFAKALGEALVAAALRKMQKDAE